jgi:hypothetical protein
MSRYNQETNYYIYMPLKVIGDHVIIQLNVIKLTQNDQVPSNFYQ